jgi:hypothetical protein
MNPITCEHCGKVLDGNDDGQSTAEGFICNDCCKKATEQNHDHGGEA